MSEVIVEMVDAHVMLVRINRPEKRNAINGAVAEGIAAAVDQSESEPAIRCVVLASTGTDSFSAGADLSEVAAGRAASLVISGKGFAGLIEAKRTRPWIAAVDAVALGGGFEMCLACDMIVASRRARFGLPEPKRGLIAGGGGVFRVAQRLPSNIASELLTVGEPLEAERAWQLGLVNRLTEPDGAVGAALDMARSIAANAPLSVRHSLAVGRLAAIGDETPLFEAMRAAGAVIRTSADAGEGVQAFLEKRPAKWRGE